MHIPDGFLTPPVWGTLAATSAAGVTLLARRAQRETDEAKLPLLGVMGAFVFAAQMINFPVGIGTSGHLLGGALLALALGPSAAALVMTAIVAVQALVFQDGGLLALGANVFNMALAGVYAGFLPIGLWRGERLRGAAIVAGGLLSVMVSGMLAVSELLVSGVRIPNALLWATLALFAVNGAVEGVITLAVARALSRLNPGWVQQRAAGEGPVPAVFGVAAVLLAVASVVVASSRPDVLESLAEGAGISGLARTWLQTPLADYEAHWLGKGWVAKAVAGLAGVAVVFIALLAVRKLLGRSRRA